MPISSPIFFNSDWGFTLASDWLLTIIKIDADWLLEYKFSWSSIIRDLLMTVGLKTV